MLETDARGVGVLGRAVPSPADEWVRGSVMSSPSRVRGGAPAANTFWAYFRASEAFY